MASFLVDCFLGPDARTRTGTPTDGARAPQARVSAISPRRGCALGRTCTFTLSRAPASETGAAAITPRAQSRRSGDRTSRSEVPSIPRLCRGAQATRRSVLVEHVCSPAHSPPVQVRGVEPRRVAYQTTSVTGPSTCNVRPLGFQPSSRVHKTRSLAEGRAGSAAPRYCPERLRLVRPTASLAALAPRGPSGWNRTSILLLPKQVDSHCPTPGLAPRRGLALSAARYRASLGFAEERRPPRSHRFKASVHADWTSEENECRRCESNARASAV